MSEQDIFMAALDQPTAEERSKFLSAACGADARLRERVEDLLRRHAQTGDFLHVPVVERLAEKAGQREAAETAPDACVPTAGAGLAFLSPSDRPGSLGRLGNYEVQEVIGSGGMGIVLRAFDDRLHRIVAIKVMAAQLATSAASRKRFEREARAAAAVCHDHIVTIHAVEESDDLPYLVMQCVSGISLQQRIDRDGPLALHEILRIGMQTASGLAAAHAQGLIHRDIKPANILLENGVERVKITDFGLARAAADASVSQTGIVAGTPQYMSPEQARGEAVDCRADLFSLGSVIYAMCTGRAPFRASNSMAVLKRVCDDATSPIREANADVPDWLIALIDKLQAKDPDDRYQSAAEVAEILGQQLAQLQHSAPLPTHSHCKPVPRRVHGRRRRSWVVAASILLVLAASFGLAEGTGTTQLAATIIRLFTPDGTLVVETNDPGVKVTVEGDSGLVIAGAGLEEIRLRPGTYHVQADRNGKPIPLDRELVTVSRGGREIVGVRLDGTAALAKADQGAFVLMAAGKESKFDALAEAVRHASAGDTIEIRGNGPFATDGVTIGNPLVIRAGEGFTPSLALSQSAADKGMPLLSTSAALVLEGLELRRSVGGGGYSALLQSPRGRGELHIANCRLICEADEPSVSPGTLASNGASAVSIRNSALLCNASGPATWHCSSGGRFSVENCVLATAGIGVSVDDEAIDDVTIAVRGNSFASRCISLTLWRKPNLPAGKETLPIRWDFSRNVVLSTPRLHDVGLFYLHQYQLQPPLSTAEAEALLPRLVRLEELGNVYQSGRRMLGLATNWKLHQATRGHDLADWNEFWNHESTGSVSGAVRFQGGDLDERAAIDPQAVAADDFRLRPDSAGYRAGPDGKDLGADIDLVGPGAAYERWKKTPEYREWLKETAQVVLPANVASAPLTAGEQVGPAKKEKLPNLIVNGSFEDGPQLDATFLPVDEGSVAIHGWVVTGGQIDILEERDGEQKPAEGIRCLDLHGSPGFGGVKQQLVTEIGRKYQVIFSMSGNPGLAYERVAMTVCAAGKQQEFACAMAGKTLNDLKWETKTWEFTAVDPITILEFRTAMPTANPFGGPLLDDVKAVAVQ